MAVAEETHFVVSNTNIGWWEVRYTYPAFIMIEGYGGVIRDKGVYSCLVEIKDVSPAVVGAE